MASAAEDPNPELNQQEEKQEEKQENGTKRRHSEELSEALDIKRQRTSPGKNSPTAIRDKEASENDSQHTPTEEQQATTGGDIRRRSSAVDEKQRSKRLFGALLGNLRQPGDRASKRRQEIESRRKAELQRQDDERLEDRQRRQEQLAEQRKTAQVKVNEENMHRRHKAMLDKANFLETEAEPRLLYRPWDLRDDEEDRIDDQIKDAQDRIDKEVGEFDERHGRKSGARKDSGAREADVEDANPRIEVDAKSEPNDAPQIDGNISGQDHASAKSDEHSGNTAVADAPETVLPTNTDATNHEENAKTAVHVGSHDDVGDEEEEDGEHAPEGDEDAVIY